MPITRSPDQPTQTLAEFYQEVVAEDDELGLTRDLPGVGRTMLQLLESINRLFQSTQLYGLTSLYRLVIQRRSNWDSPWYVIIVASRRGSYNVQYLLPAPNQSWPDAYVHGEAESLAEAERYLLIAMRESGGWAGNAELAALLERYGESK